MTIAFEGFPKREKLKSERKAKNITCLFEVEGDFKICSLGIELVGPNPNPISLVSMTVAAEHNFVLERVLPRLVTSFAGREDDKADQGSYEQTKVKPDKRLP